MEVKVASLAEVYDSLFPGEPFHRTPLLPADLFAFVGHVLERSGAYHHVAPIVTASNKRYRRLLVDDKLRRRAISNGKRWRNDRTPPPELPRPPKRVRDVWAALQNYRTDTVFTELRNRAKPPEWWVLCLELLMIADEASSGTGFPGKNQFYDFATLTYKSEDYTSGNVLARVQHAPFSISTASDDLVCFKLKRVPHP
jgi:hypothetical protein